MVGHTRGTPDGFGCEAGSGSQQPPPPPSNLAELMAMQTELMGVAVVAEIHCQFHNQSHQAFRVYDQPSEIMEDIH